MKKVLALVMALVLVLSLAACGGNKEVKLTMDNINDYLSVTATCDCSIDSDSGSIGGLYYNNYSGDATVDIKITNKTSAKFENTKVTLYVSNVVFTGGSNGVICGWEFTNGNIHEGSGMAASNKKTIELELPSDGNLNKTEHLKLTLYGQWKDLLNRTPNELSDSDIIVGIEDVSGVAVQ